MLDLAKVKLSSAIVVGDSFYPIKTDFRYWLIFSKLLQDDNTKLIDLDFLYENTIPEDRIGGYAELLNFYNPPKELPKITGRDDTKILDYVTDSELIYSAFFEQYGLDLFDENIKLHWHKFQALLSGLHNTKLTDVMGYRSYDGKDKELLKLKRMWELPQNRELSQATKDFNALFDVKK